MTKKQNRKTYTRYSYILYCQKAVEKAIEMDTVLNYAYIKHDKDNEKKDHYHLLIRYNNSIPTTTAYSRIHDLVKDNTADTTVKCQPIRDRYAMYDYLMHNNDTDDKYQYPEQDIVTNNSSYWKKNIQEKITAIDIVEDILIGMSSYDLTKKYGFTYLTYREKLNAVVLETQIDNEYSISIRDIQEVDDNLIFNDKNS